MGPPRLLKPSEVAHLFDVRVETVVEWARTGKLRATRTPGGRYRIFATAIDAILNNNETGLPGAGTTEQALTASPPAA